ncbi:hypothetical protein A2382_04265 [Candidatus Woesebacteria bacterium RIFOXYB1_FULL_38_16]|uniref:Uncharacterized protein n=1 Tax=Candidatus Woesebacteria bacterium RIFOXYB1_FULL_38_16 TaxID=1802538 RepID=A0A1F8CW65_9BACT|nr:MAG: hypothetical protein A2191_04345 [Candidatus Woesebacteria bacterium RIFOXYA1_FULL_38_9]OGM79785.1 MAG: hypothetical protein A2382_04265 [Candidatus Woesebacteria bacterium RIFOXYB1_FULL_38_16]
MTILTVGLSARVVDVQDTQTVRELFRQAFGQVPIDEVVRVTIDGATQNLGLDAPVTFQTQAVDLDVRLGAKG